MSSAPPRRRPTRRRSGTSASGARRGSSRDMKFTMAQPQVSCHPELLLDGAARTVVSAALCYWVDGPEPSRRRRPAAALCLARPLRAPPRTPRRPRPLARRELPGARRCEPARRSRGRAPRGRRLLRQEHDVDHPRARLLGRARDARHRRRDRGDAAARARLRPLPALHRRVPHRRSRRAGRARRESVPLVLDAGTGAAAGALPGGARGVGLRLRHLPGRLPLEPGDREAAGGFGARRTRPSRMCRSSTG